VKYSITKEIQFDAGHRVPLHESKCKNPHGHRYRVVAEVEGELQAEGSSTDMVLDFGDLKTIMQTLIHDKYDHSFIVWTGDSLWSTLQAWKESNSFAKIVPVDFHPTAEQLANHFFQIVSSNLFGDLKLKSLTVWETPTSSATVEEGN
jgi:6-pyruvoyltetrahydropterin/6-carboxytetrahydropterin synthase